MSLFHPVEAYNKQAEQITFRRTSRSIVDIAIQRAEDPTVNCQKLVAKRQRHSIEAADIIEFWASVLGELSVRSSTGLLLDINASIEATRSDGYGTGYGNSIKPWQRLAVVLTREPLAEVHELRAGPYETPSLVGAGVLG